MSKKNDAFRAWLAKWTDYNTTGRGKEKATFEDYEYDGDTVFSNRIPWMRLQCNLEGHWIRLVRTVKIDIPLHAIGTSLSLPQIYLPCIGTFTPYPDDRMHGPELLERLRYIMLSQTRWIATELIPATPAHLLAATPHPRAQRTRVYVEKSDEWWTKRLQDQYARYDFFRMMLARDWPTMPTYLIDDAQALMSKKVQEYQSDEASAQRLRSRAKRIANKVLDSY